MARHTPQDGALDLEHVGQMTKWEMVLVFSPPPSLCSRISHLAYILTAGALTEVLWIHGAGNSRREFVFLEVGAVKTGQRGWILLAGCG